MKQFIVCIFVIFIFDYTHAIDENCFNKTNYFNEYLGVIKYIRKSAAEEKIEKLEKSGFECNKKPEEVDVRGYVCVGQLPDYADKVRVYIPKALDDGLGVKMNVFFHGLRREDTFLQNNDGSGYGDYGARLKEANDKKSILIIPESSTQVKSYEQFIQNPKLLTNLIDQIQSSAGWSRTELTISGHSGAYRVINGLLADNQIRTEVKRVAMFDAIYGFIPNVESWLKQNSQNKLRLSWISGMGQSTEKYTQSFIERTQLQTNQIKKIEVKGSLKNTHMNIMQSGGLADFIRGE